jgi:alkylation response protein AidB-like acyl-CoA dehydrogenase
MDTRLDPSGDDEALALLLPQVARFCREEVNGDAIDRDACIPKRVRDAAGQLGLFGMTIPADFGGGDLPLAATCRVVAEIARVDRSVAIMIGLHAGLGTRGLVERGAPDLQRTWLPRLASGDCIASFAATEAGAGSDLHAIRTTGEAAGDALRIDGEKTYVTNGGFAGLFTALVRTPGIGGERGCSLVCIPADTPGVSIGKEERKLGIRGSSTVTVRFERAMVPRDHVLGEPGRGMELVHELLTWGRTLMSAGCVGTAQGALDAAIEHAKTRRQFGRPIGEFVATRAHLAWMAARVHAMRAFVLDTAEAHARGEPIDRPSAIAKVFASESAFEVCDRALQLHGALGFVEGTGIARTMRDCRITRIFEGANDVLLVRIGAARLAARRESEPLAADAPAIVAELARRFTAAVDDARARYGALAIRRQLVLQRIALAEIALRVAEATARRGADDAVAEHAVRELLGEGHAALDALSRAEQDEDAAAKVSARLFAC